MLSGRENILARLMLAANHLQQVQCLAQDDATCIQLLREIHTVHRALTAIKVDLIQWYVSNCLSVLQDRPDSDMQVKELNQLIELFSMV